MYAIVVINIYVSSSAAERSGPGIWERVRLCVGSTGGVGRAKNAIGKNIVAICVHEHLC